MIFCGVLKGVEVLCMSVKKLLRTKMLKRVGKRGKSEVIIAIVSINGPRFQ